MISAEELQALYYECMPLFIALGDEVRLTIIAFLNGSLLTGQNGLNVNEITERTNLSRPAVSHHLKILKDAGLVNVRKEGTNNYYYLTIADSTQKLMTLGQELMGVLESQNVYE